MPRLLLLAALIAHAEDWSRFRGPNGSGIATGAGYPIEFGANKNTVWRTEVRPGKSSPVLTDKHVLITGFADNKLYTQCFDRASGKLLWEKFIDKKHDQITNALNHAAAITPLTDGRNVYSFFKDFGVVAYDLSGKELWRAPLGPFVNTMGVSASPIDNGSTVVVMVDQLGGSFLAAFDKKSGEMRWKAERDEFESWGTPLRYKDQFLTVSRGIFGAHLASNGKRTSSMPGFPATIIGSPIVDGNRFYLFGYGADSPKPFAPELDKMDKNKDGKLGPDEYNKHPLYNGYAYYQGDRDGYITEAEWSAMQQRIMGANGLYAYEIDATAKSGEIKLRELWKYERPFNSVIPSLIVANGVLFSVKNGGILTAFDAATGKLGKAERIPGALGGYSSSLVAAEGRIYACSEEGKVSVIKAALDWELIKTNDLNEGCFATPAMSNGQIYLRTDNALYRFGAK